MLELALTSYLNLENIASTLNPTLSNKFGRSNFAAGMNANRIMVVGGLAGIGTPGGEAQYSFPQKSIALSGGTVTSYTTIGAFTWCSGVAVGNELFFLDGHTGNYVATFRKINIDTGVITTLAAAPTPYRHSSTLVHNPANSTLMRAFGYTGTTTNSCAIYNISANTWGANIVAPIDLNGVNGECYGGKFYFPFGWSESEKRSQSCIRIYNPSNNTWTKSPDIESSLYPNGIAWGVSCLVGDVIYYFAQAIPDHPYLSVIKYYINQNRFEYGITNLVQRFAGKALVHPTTKDIYLVHGCRYAPGTANYDNLVRNTDIVVIKSHLSV